jgi:hypothetical protein
MPTFPKTTFDFTLYGKGETVNFADTSFAVRSSTSKWTFGVRDWKFDRPDNTLELDIALSHGVPFNYVSEQTHVLPGNFGGMEHAMSMREFQLQSDDKTLFIRVLGFAVVDGHKKVPVVCELVRPNLDKLRLTFPAFNSSLVMDPDFSIVFSPKYEKDIGECPRSAEGDREDEDDDDKGEDLGMILGIVFGLLFLALVVMALVVGLGFILYKRRKTGRFFRYAREESNSGSA